MTPLDCALRLADEGFKVFPLRENQKTPAISNWRELATDRWAVIDGWWHTNSRWNVGIVADWFCAVDCDVKDQDGRRNFADVLDGLGLPRRPKPEATSLPVAGCTSSTDCSQA